MNREQRLEREQAWYAEQEKKKQEKEWFITTYNKLSYRNKLLMNMIVNFMIVNPDCEHGGKSC